MPTDTNNPEKLLKALRRSEGNKTCPNCGHFNEFGYGNVCVKYKTFVCDLCKTSHQAISHRVKSITMSTWSLEEVKELCDEACGGNDAARHNWLLNAPTYGGRYPGGARPKDGDKIEVFKQFIIDCYEHQKFKSNTSYIPSPKSTTTTVGNRLNSKIATSESKIVTTSKLPTTNSNSLIDIMNDDPLPSSAPVSHSVSASSFSEIDLFATSATTTNILSNDLLSHDDGFTSFQTASPHPIIHPVLNSQSQANGSFPTSDFSWSSVSTVPVTRSSISSPAYSVNPNGVMNFDVFTSNSTPKVTSQFDTFLDWDENPSSQNNTNSGTSNAANTASFSGTLSKKSSVDSIAAVLDKFNVSSPPSPSSRNGAIAANAISNLFIEPLSQSPPPLGVRTPSQNQLYFAPLVSQIPLIPGTRSPQPLLYSQSQGTIPLGGYPNGTVNYIGVGGGMSGFPPGAHPQTGYGNVSRTTTYSNSPSLGVSSSNRPITTSNDKNSQQIDVAFGFVQNLMK